MALLYEPERETKVLWGKYIIQRFFRIYPLLFFATLIIWALAEYGILKNTTHNCRGVTPHDSLMIAQLLLYKGWCNFWTIPVEVHFYLAFIISISALNLLKLRPNTKLLLIGVGFVATALLIKLNIYDRQLIMVMHANSYPVIWKYLPFFFAGVFTGLIYKYYKDYLQKYPIIWNSISIVITAMLIMYLIPRTNVMLPSPHYFWKSSFHLLVLPSLIGTYILSCALARRPFDILTNSLPLRFTGKISYSLYIVHPAIYMLIFNHIHYNKWGLITLALSWSFMVACITYLVIEKPCIDFGQILYRNLCNRTKKSASASTSTM